MLKFCKLLLNSVALKPSQNDILECKRDFFIFMLSRADLLFKYKQRHYILRKPFIFGKNKMAKLFIKKTAGKAL